MPISSISRKLAAPGLAALIALAPLSVLAASTFKQLVDGPVVTLGNLLSTLVYAIAFLIFMFGVFKYFFVSGANAEESRQKGKQLMLWGVIALAVMFAVWGIVKVFLSILQSWA
ncbi:MAG: hypothetical protein QOE22_237 [Candidatus Parcubacteria bacterium]|jgi:hypothetical protein|nr:hypothetical protein [Candidatus Parcubacteria bacterium]